MNKVYSIWFYNHRYFDDDIPVRSFGMREFSSLSQNCVSLTPNRQTQPKYIEEADLLEVIIIELPKIRNIKDNHDLIDILYLLCGGNMQTQRYKELFSMTDKEVLDMNKDDFYVLQ